MPAVAIDGAPVPVVFFRTPVASPPRDTPFRLVTVTAFDPLVVASPESSAAVIADPDPRTSPVNVDPVPVPPCPIVTTALDVSMVAVASGSVKVFSVAVGPLNFANPFPVPP